jgi:hypothetical protein
MHQLRQMKHLTYQHSPSRSQPQESREQRSLDHGRAFPRRSGPIELVKRQKISRPCAVWPSTFSNRRRPKSAEFGANRLNANWDHAYLLRLLKI